MCGYVKILNGKGWGWCEWAVGLGVRATVRASVYRHERPCSSLGSLKSQLPYGHIHMLWCGILHVCRGSSSLAMDFIRGCRAKL